jgi:hypothetical protein
VSAQGRGVTALAELPALGQVKQLAERETREMYWRSLGALVRRGKVPNVALSHLAVRVLLFLLGQRPGYFAHQKLIADAVESNLTSVRKALFELRDAGFVSWDLIPPHHPLPTGKYTRTNVNQYFVEADALLRALGGDAAAGPPKTVAPTHPNPSASTGTDPKFEQDLPLTPSSRSEPPPDRCSGRGEIQFSKFPGARPALGQTHDVAGIRRADQGAARTVPPELEKVLGAWRALDLGEPDDRSIRALRNRHAEGATTEQLAGAVEGARHDQWLRQGHAKSPFAVVFASLASIDRFAKAGRDHARKTEAAARVRAAERRAARAQFEDVAALSPAENAELAALALKSMVWPAPPMRSNGSAIAITNLSRPPQLPPPASPPREIPCTKATAEIQVGRRAMSLPQAILDLENRNVGDHGEPTLGAALALAAAEWRSGNRDRELCLHLLFLSWYCNLEPPHLTGYRQTAFPSGELSELFHDVYTTFADQVFEDAECL